jgi:hypothetical protein
MAVPAIILAIMLGELIARPRFRQIDAEEWQKILGKRWKVSKPSRVLKISRKDYVVQDEKFYDAERLAKSHTYLSPTILQEELAIGYARAASLLDDLQSLGVVGVADRRGRRHVVDLSGATITGQSRKGKKKRVN